MTYKYYCCTGGNFLEAPQDKIIQLGLQDKISPLSHYDAKKKIVYLHADNDVMMFVYAEAGMTSEEVVLYPSKADKRAGEVTRWFSINILPRNTHILALPHYRPEQMHGESSTAESSVGSEPGPVADPDSGTPLKTPRRSKRPR